MNERIDTYGIERVENYTHTHKHIYTNPTPPHEQYVTQSQFFKRSLNGLNSEFSFSETSCLIKVKEHNLSYCLTHSWRENSWIHSFSVQCEMQTISSRNWTPFTMSISFNNNHYTMAIYVWGVYCICRWLPPDRTWHKVKSPKAD